MVRAILAGKKTQTRRIAANRGRLVRFDGVTARFVDEIPDDPVPADVSHRYGVPGDRLWVRETWCDLTETHGTPWEKFNPATKCYERGRHRFVWYRADGEQPGLGDCVSVAEPWRPSIHMPRWASRITLEVIGVRVARLQSITEEDAKAEGVEPRYSGDYRLNGQHITGAPYRHSFFVLWDKINGDRATWASSPWVWVVSFRKIAPESERWR